jgi:D-alanyl-D-alanine endopeptidase (penicillin-binding protein 7)
MKALAFLPCAALCLLPTPTLAKHRRVRSFARPVAAYTPAGLPNVQAQAAMVLDFTTGQELFAKNPDAIRPIASISKLMAMMVVLDRNLELEKPTTMMKEDLQIAHGGARSRLPIGMAFSNRDLLHAALMASDNRAVPALGRAVGLDPGQMVRAMNQKAHELGLKHTHFDDPVGLAVGNCSSPRDVAGMLKAAIKYPLLAEITRKAHYVAHPFGKPGWVIDYNNTDVIARGGRYEVITGKTGYTDLALYCLAIAVRMSEHHDVGMVFLGAVGKMTRFGDFGRVAQWLTERKWSKTAALGEKSR